MDKFRDKIFNEEVFERYLKTFKKVFFPLDKNQVLR